MIPYGRHSINDDDIARVVAALKSDWLTTGPLVEEFEAALEKLSEHPVSLSLPVPRLCIVHMQQLDLRQVMKL